MEVCVDSIASAVNAEKGGANRIELCESLAEGGLTPSIGFLRKVKEHISIPVFVLIRPRGGDFLYSSSEVEVMEADIILSLENGAHGIVLGALTDSGEVDEEICRRLIRKCGNIPVTFHRAFDLTTDPMRALSGIMKMGFSRILTSGQAPDALTGLPVIKELTKKASGSITIMPGGGINCGNLEEILVGSGVKEFHSSASSYVTSQMKLTRQSVVKLGASSSELRWKQCDMHIVYSLKLIANRVWGAAPHT